MGRDAPQSADDEESLSDWLEGINLREALPAFREQGLEQVNDMLGLDDETIEKLGLQALEKQALMEKIAGITSLDLAGDKLGNDNVGTQRIAAAIPKCE